MHSVIIPNIPSLPIIKSMKSISPLIDEKGPLAFFILGRSYLGIGMFIISSPHSKMNVPFLEI